MVEFRVVQAAQPVYQTHRFWHVLADGLLRIVVQPQKDVRVLTTSLLKLYAFKAINDVVVAKGNKCTRMQHVHYDVHKLIKIQATRDRILVYQFGALQNVEFRYRVHAFEFSTVVSESVQYPNQFRPSYLGRA
jgi:hypothetical protein